MSKEMIISSSRHETKIALTEDGQVVEVYVEREKEVGLVGSIYKGRVTRVLPGMQSAFVDIDLDRDAFLYVSDFSENLEGYDHAPATQDDAEETAGDSAPGDKEQAASSRKKTARRSRRSRVTRRGRKPKTAKEDEAATPPAEEEPVAAAGDTAEPGGETETPAAAPTPEAGEAAPEESPEKTIVAAEAPELELPEKRPAGRARSVRPRQRGGRGRGTRGTGRGSRRPSSGASAQPGKGEVEPVVLLPGESIAMYRELGTPEEARVDATEEATQETPSSLSAESATLPEETVEAPVQEPVGEIQTTTSLEAASPDEAETPPPAAAEADADAAAESGGETAKEFAGIPRAAKTATEPEVKESTGETEPQPAEKTEEAPETSVEEPSADTAEPVAAEAESSLPESSPEADSQTGETTTDPEEAGTLDEYLAGAVSTGTRDELDDALTELQRFRSYQDEVGLPPSVQERTADGVDWHDDEEETEDSATTETTGDVDEEAVPAEAQATEAAEAAEGGEKKPATRRRRITRGGRGRGRGTRSKSATDKTDETGTKDVEDEAPGTRSRSASTRTGSRTAGRRSTGGNGRRTSRSRTGASRPAPRRRTSARPSQGQPAIAELLKAGQEIIIQIAKAQIGQKGARITSHVTLPGRYLVYMPTIDHIGVSRKIGTADERARLRRTLLAMKGKAAGGFVVRTAAADCTEEELQADVDYLVRLWHDMVEKSEHRKAPVILHQDLDLVQRLLRDQLSRSYDNVWIDNEEEYTRVAEFVGKFLPKLSNKVKLYTRDEDIFEEMGVQQEIDRALRPKVWLKSGGYIVVNQTEALVAIDINTGKFVGKGSTRLEDTIVKTNIEAVKEIVRQVRLRDLGGIIVIDFIDMEDRRNRTKVMRALENALQVDRQPSKILPFNEFGLVAITRKRSKQSLERILCQPCPYCTGTGMLKSIQTLCIEIQNEARNMAQEMDAPELTIRANPDIVAALKGEVSGLVHELEEEFDKNIILQADESLHFEHYNIF